MVQLINYWQPITTDLVKLPIRYTLLPPYGQTKRMGIKPPIPPTEFWPEFDPKNIWLDLFLRKNNLTKVPNRQKRREKSKHSPVPNSNTQHQPWSHRSKAQHSTEHFSLVITGSHLQTTQNTQAHEKRKKKKKKKSLLSTESNPGSPNQSKIQTLQNRQNRERNGGRIHSMTKNEVQDGWGEK